MQAKRHLKIDDKYPIGHDVNKYFEDSHDHNYYEFLYIIRGSAINVINDELQILKKGMMIAVRPDDIHFIKKTETCNDNFEFFNIPVPVDYMHKQYQKCPTLKEKIESGNIPACVKLSNTELGVLCGKALKLVDMNVSPERTYIFFGLVKELCLCMLEYNIDLNDKPLPLWFSKLLYEINDINAEELTYDVILEKVHVSKSVLCKMFKKVLGITPTYYINDKKMKKAYEMVISNNKTLIEIAYELGYGSYTHFRREFIKKYHTTPNELRENDYSRV